MFGLIDNNLRDAAAERRGSRRDSAVEARVKIIVYSWLLPPNSDFHPLLSSWPDIAERTIDSTSRGCRGKLQDALERPTANLSAACRAEVGRTLERQSRREDESSRRGEKGSSQGGAAGASSSPSAGSKGEKSKAETHTATVVLAFVTCALVAFAAVA
eukprot:jgi/Undpi1/12337/HiC_scaffold_5.g02013.m1